MKLAEYFPVFPSPSGCDSHGKKGDFVRKAEEIAKEMKTARPRTEVPWDMTSGERPKGMVVKREYSDCSRHVFVPEHTEETASPKQIKGEDTRYRKFLEANTDKDKEHFRWIAQEYVQTLQAVGEIRFMCVDGEIPRETITVRKPQGLVGFVDDIKTMISLNDMR
jgi:hypothetical protein